MAKIKKQGEELALELYESKTCFDDCFDQAREIFPDLEPDVLADWIYDRLICGHEDDRECCDALYEMIVAGLT